MSIDSLPPAGELLASLPAAALYAEVHYRHGRLPSLLYRHFPEVIVDLPQRLEPGWEGDRLPLLLLIKDAHRYPVTVESLRVDLRTPGGRHQQVRIKLGWRCREAMQHRILPLPLGPLARSGKLIVAAEVRVREDLPGRGRVHRVRGDSYSRWPTLLHTHAAADPYPSASCWALGDLHHHTSYTNDQVEFGAPPEVTARFAAAAGCHWAALTDHSYDLDDAPLNCLYNRPDVPLWRRLREEAAALNRTGGGAWLLAGEEVSCGGEGEHNLHLLTFGHQRFLPGAGDGAERWFFNDPTFPLAEQLRRVALEGGTAYAAHPFEEVGRSQRIAFRRATWSAADLQQPLLSGLQIWNGRGDDGLREGLRRWLELLRQGRRLAIGAGNDAHGNFSLGRFVAVPFLRLAKSGNQVYGRARTALRVEGPVNDGALVAALAGGRSTVTNGPALLLTAEQGERHLEIGDSLRPGLALRVHARGWSTPELGLPERLLLYLGSEGAGERVVACASAHSAAREVRLEVSLPSLPPRGWLRAELRAAAGAGGAEPGLALSNPIWIG
jgi:hypothetical protein